MSESGNRHYKVIISIIIIVIFILGYYIGYKCCEVAIWKKVEKELAMIKAVSEQRNKEVEKLKKYADEIEKTLKAGDGK